MGTESKGLELHPEIDPEDIPRCPEMDGSTLKIVPNFTEAGWYMEANCITVTDGERTAIYVPYRKVDEAETEAIRTLNSASSPEGE